MPPTFKEQYGPGSKPASWSVPISTPKGKNRLEKCLGSYCMVFPTCWFSTNTLFPFLYLFVFITMSCSFFSEKCGNYSRFKLVSPWKIYCIKAWKITSCFRKCAAVTLFQRSLLLWSWYYWSCHVGSPGSYSMEMMWLEVVHWVISDMFICITKGNDKENICMFKISTWYFKNGLLTYFVHIFGSLSGLILSPRG